MRRLLLPAAAVAAAAIVTAVLLAGGGSAASPRLAAPFALPGVRDREVMVALSSFRDRPVVVNFFASWCVPCRDELPAFESAHRRLGDRVAFVGVDYKDSRAGARKLLASAKVTYPAGYDPQGEVGTRYAVQGMPTTVFIGRDGRVAGRVTGRLRAADLDRWLGRLTAA